MILENRKDIIKRLYTELNGSECDDNRFYFNCYNKDIIKQSLLLCETEYDFNYIKDYISRNSCVVITIDMYNIDHYISENYTPSSYDKLISVYNFIDKLKHICECSIGVL